MPTISIIVPAFNVERYIEKCLNSILDQTFRDFEILLIDDGATDSTSELCDQFACQDTRVKVYHKSNGGLSDARNYGLDRADGEYVTFIDSDDYVALDYLEYLYKLITRFNAQISMVNGQTLLESDEPCISGSISEMCLTSEQAVRRMLLRKDASHSSWGKLYQLSLWYNIRFPVNQNYEDYATTYRIYAAAETVGCSNARLYYYIQRPNSIMHDFVSEKTLSLLDVSDEATRFMLRQWPGSREEIVDLQAATYLKSLQKILNSGMNSYPEYQHRIIEYLRENALFILRSGRIPRNDKVKVFSLLLGKKFFLKLYNKFDGDRRL